MNYYVITSIIVFFIYTFIGVFTNLFFVKLKWLRIIVTLLYYVCIINTFIAICIGIYKLLT